MRKSYNNTVKMKLIEIDSDEDLDVNKQTTKENSTTQPECNNAVGDGLICHSKMSRMGIEEELNTSELDRDTLSKN